MSPAPTPIDYSKIPTGRLGPTASGGTASLVIVPSRENHGTIGLYIYEDVGGNSWPMSVNHGRAVKLGKLVGHDGADVERVLRENEKEIRFVDAAYQGTRWDGNNHVGVWAGSAEGEDNADAPIEALTEALSNSATYWDTNSYFDAAWSETLKDLFDAMSTGESVADFAKHEVERARQNGILLDHDEVEQHLLFAVDEGAAEKYRPRIDLAKVAASRYAALVKSSQDPETGAREVLPLKQRVAECGVVRGGRFVLRCECSEMDGVSCEAILSEDDAVDVVVVEWMPEHLRASHEAAGNRGTYPTNGARRLVLHGGCTEQLVEDDGEWSRIVE